jgi:hypothetical protein
MEQKDGVLGEKILKTIHALWIVIIKGKNWACKAFITQPLVRRATFMVVGLLLALSLFGMYRSFTIPYEQLLTVPLLAYEQTGRFNYRVHLKPNSLFETMELDAGQSYFLRLVENIQLHYTYQLTADQAVQDPNFIYTATAIFGVPELWEREFPLVPPTAVSAESFSFPVALPIPYFLDTLQAVQQEIGSNLRSPQLTVQIQIIPAVTTAGGQITEPFTHNLQIAFEDNLVYVGTNLSKRESGSLTTSTWVTRENTRRARAYTIISTVLTTSVLAALIWYNQRYRPALPSYHQELRTAKRHLKGLLVYTDALPPVSARQVIVHLSSIWALINLAEDTLRPVMYSENGPGYHYCLMDERGATRYEYHNKTGINAPEGAVSEEKDGWSI